MTKQILVFGNDCWKNSKEVKLQIHISTEQHAEYVLFVRTNATCFPE